jgi:hypothetical protein
MSQQQIVHFKLLKLLLCQLRNFGLNPTEWKIDRTSQIGTNQIFLVNRDDQQFQFLGNLGVKNGLLAWRDLTLISL